MVIIFARNAFRSSRIAFLRSASSNATKKSKKSFNDLPDAFTLPDGTTAPPLVQWQSRNAPVASSRTMLPREDDTCNTLTKLSNGSKKRGRKSKVLSDALAMNPRAPAPTRKQNVQEDETVNDLPRTGLAREILDNLNQFPHCLLLTRVGQFYESYFEQAVEIAQLLNIKLASRKWGGQRVHMCGFPIMHLDKYLKVLVQQNKRFVALCEEFPRHSDFGVKEFERRVARVVTPGTLIDEPFLNPYENNYLLAVSTIEEPSPQSPVGLAWMDVSTGEFFFECSTCEHFLDELARINPKEVVLDEKLRSIPSHPILLALGEESACVSYIQPTPVAHTPSTDASLSTAEVYSINLLNTFLRANLLEYMPSISSPKHEARCDRMQIDSHTIKALEIREGFVEGGTKGTLLSAIKRTTTTSGARLLARWLCSPSTSLTEINARQSLVSLFFTRPHLCADVIHLLRGSDDIRRVSQKFLLGRGDISDLLALSRTVNVWSTIKRRIEEERRLERVEKGEDFNDEDWNSIDSLMSRMSDFHDLTKRIVSAVGDGDLVGGLSSSVELPEPVSATATDPEPTEIYGNKASYLNSGKCLIKPSFSQKIATLHSRLKELLEERVRLELHFQETYNTPSLSLRSSPAHGLHVHLAKAKRDRAKLDDSANFVSIAESATTKCYFNKQWSQLGVQISETATTLIDVEKEAFEGLRAEVNLYATALRRNAHILDELDIALGFANLAAEMNFIRPVLTDDASYQVLDGRHPSVELGLLTSGRVFTSNSLEMTPESRLHVITGPNMAGKSTFLRQAALITIMAQIGTFVPASSASIGIVDKLFSRIGAKDDLFHDRSTFMVEMLETAEILRRATPRSLVIMDEVGRGTTVRDGLAIAFATLHHLSLHNKCRALFATHFHELADMLDYPEHKSRGPHGHVSFFCTDVHETDDDHFAYSYRLRPGINRDSHGLKVAQLAGMPPVAMQVARDALSWLNSNTVYSTILPYSEVIRSIQADPDIEHPT